MERLEINTTDVENLDDMVRETNKALGEISRRMNITSNNVDKMNKKLSDLDTKMTNRIDGIESKMDKIMKHFGID